MSVTTSHPSRSHAAAAAAASQPAGQPHPASQRAGSHRALAAARSPLPCPSADTSSDEAMLDGNLALLEANPIVDHRRYTNAADSNSYATSKIETERMWEAAAAASGAWDVFHCNPGDIIGPIVSAHQETGFQGQVGQLLQGKPLGQHSNGRPWMTVDVRDVAAAHVGLLVAETAAGVPSEGQHRYLLDTNDKVFRENLGEHLNAALVRPSQLAAPPTSWTPRPVRHRRG
jgi:nucleoside-diphosphate-sugar epimerase